MRKSILVLAILTAFSCSKSDPDNENNCARATCTLVFAAVNVKVQDKSGNNINLQKVYTVNTNTGDTLTFEQYDSGESYVVIDDNYVNKMYNKTYDFLFIGELNNTVTFAEPFTISADCCHISRDAGKDVITVD